MNKKIIDLRCDIKQTNELEKGLQYPHVLL